MMKKIFVIFSLLFFLAACGKGEPKIDFKGPSSAPDPSKLMPSYGPNDAIPENADMQIGDVKPLQ